MYSRLCNVHINNNLSMYDRNKIGSIEIKYNCESILTNLSGVIGTKVKRVIIY